MRSHVIMCQRQFVPAILSGAKPHTIRSTRKRAICVGDQLDLRAWTGKPYRSKQEKLCLVTVTTVRNIKISSARLDVWPLVGSAFQRLTNT